MRHWDNWGTYEKRNHVFLCPLEITSSGLLKAEESALIDLMFGLETDCPGKGMTLGKFSRTFCDESVYAVL